jgi:hypothetical protein
MSACGTPSVDTGTISGGLSISGGLPPGQQRPTNGSVEATGKGGVAYSTALSKNGQFVFHLPPGTYSLTGTSPKYGGGKYTCLGSDKINVSQGHTTKADVNCAEK